jgi:hypothetical protein
LLGIIANNNKTMLPVSLIVRCGLACTAFLVTKKIVTRVRKNQKNNKSFVDENDACETGYTVSIDTYGENSLSLAETISAAMSTTAATTVTCAASVISDDESALAGVSSELSGAKLVTPTDAVHVTANTYSAPHLVEEENAVITENITPRTNSLKRLASSMKRTLSGSKKGLTSSL